jgi:hypothetical protein
VLAAAAAAVVAVVRVAAAAKASVNKAIIRILLLGETASSPRFAA